jgi:holin-like protein
MLSALGMLLGFQLAGECAAWALNGAVPGPIIGLVLLFGWLQVRRARDPAARGPAAYEAIEATDLGRTAMPLLRNLAILFVAPGVGALDYADLFIAHGTAVLVVLLVPTLLAMATTALVFAACQRAERASRARQAAPETGRIPS